MGKPARWILHADMDAFYASVEQRDRPELRGKPVVVGGASDRGVVAAASYEARTFGIHSAMPSARARQRCPALIFLRGDMARYKAESKRIFAIFRDFSPKVEGLSLDEAFLDLTGTERALGVPRVVGEHLRERVRAEVGLAISVGIAPVKLVAKIASAAAKPDGLLLVEAAAVGAFLAPLPVRRLWGVGPVTARKLRARGIEKLVDVRTVDPAMLRETVGSLADWLRALAQGVDDRPVVPEHDPKSSGSEHTFAHDLTDLDEIRATIQTMARNAAAWLVRHELYARTVTLKVRYHDFTTITRSHTNAPTRDADSIVERALTLLDRTEAGTRPVRLLGVSVHNFGPETVVAPGPQARLPFEV